MKSKSLKLLAFLVTFLTNALVASTPILLCEGEQIVEVREELELFIPGVQDISLEEVRNQSFLKYDNWKTEIKADASHWGRLVLQNDCSVTHPTTNWVLEFPIILTDIEVYALSNIGDIQHGITGQFVPIKDRSFVPVIKANQVLINIAKGETATIYFKAICARKYAIPNFDLELLPADVFYNKLKNKRLIQGLFIGFMMMMLIYNLFLYFFSTKDKAYFHYSIYLLGIVLYSAYNSDILADVTNSLFFPEMPKYAYFGKISTYIVIWGYLYFLRAFLHLEKLLPKWNRILQIVLWINLTAFVADVILMLTTNFNSDISDIVTVGNAIVFIVFIFLLCIFLFRTKDKNSYFIIAGIILMGIGAVITIIARINGLEYSTISFQIGTILEVIIFSLGLAYRRNGMEREKQQAYFELQKNEMLRAQEKKESERLMEVDQLKTKLYTNITHEFRTPLTVINGNLDFIKSHEKEKAIIKRNSDQMLRLINQMLDLSKLEADLLELQLIQSDIVEFLQYVTESFHSMASVKNIRLVFYSEEQSLFMDFDKEKMEHIVYNLISNAIKFTQPGGKIILHLKKEILDTQPMFQLKVKDTGIGIDQKRFSQIFDRYYKLNYNSEIGTGIGLAFVKELVEMQHGSISVQSEVNVGSEFSILIPITNRATEVVLPSQKSKMINAVDHAEDSKAVPIDEDKPILLLIEDNRDVSNYIKKLLNGRYQLHFAYDGEEGIRKAIQLVPDIIISDVIMPKKDGYAVTTFLKDNQKTSHIPIILLTAKASQMDKKEGLLSGADSYLLKPFDKEELLIRLTNIDRQRKILIEKIQSGFFGNSNDKLVLASKENNFLISIKNHLLGNLSDPEFGVDEIATLMGLNKNQFYRKIKAIAGQTPTQFVREIRLSEAEQLLKNSELNVSEVAYRVGFRDPNYFTRIFQKKYGKSPSKFTN